MTAPPMSPGSTTYHGDVSDTILGQVGGPSAVSPIDYRTAMSASYTFTPGDAEWPRGSTVVEWAFGIICGNCHSFIDPSELTALNPRLIDQIVRHCLRVNHEECPS